MNATPQELPPLLGELQELLILLPEDNTPLSEELATKIKRCIQQSYASTKNNNIPYGS